VQARVCRRQMIFARRLFNQVFAVELINDSDDGCVNQHRLDIEPSSDASVASENLAQHIQRYVVDASLLRAHGHELIFTLPLASAGKFTGNFLC